MTVGHTEQVSTEEAVAGRSAGAEPATPGRATTGRSLIRHVVALCVVLVALMPVVGIRSLMSSDEGAAIVQTARLAGGHGWVMHHPLPTVDPARAAFPLMNSTVSKAGYAPFVKHALYPVLLVPLYRAGGVPALMLLSLAGVVGAALAAGFLAKQLDDRTAVAAFWAVGLASPLFIDGYLVIAHTLGAALAGGGMLAVLAARRHPRPWLLVAAAAAFGTGALLRNEMALLGVAVAVVVGAKALRRRDGAGIITAAVVGAATVAAYELDSVLASHLLPGVPTDPVRAIHNDGPFLVNRLYATLMTVVMPSYFRFGIADILLVMTVAVGCGAVLVTRARVLDRPGFRLLSGVASLAALMRLLFTPLLVPSISFAFPLLTVGLVAFAAHRRLADREPAAELLAVAGLFAGCVLVTQYTSGGGEWGWRYVAVALPLVVPVAVDGLARAGDRLDGRSRRMAVAAIVVASASASASGLMAARAIRQQNHRLVTSTTELVRRAPVEDGLPVVVSTAPWVGRLAWDHLDEGRWLMVPDDDLDAYLVRLRNAGIEQIIFVAGDPQHDTPIVDRRFHETERTQIGDYAVMRLHARSSPSR